jgi:hypothetical protein
MKEQPIFNPGDTAIFNDNGIPYCIFPNDTKVTVLTWDGFNSTMQQNLYFVEDENGLSQFVVEDSLKPIQSYRELEDIYFMVPNRTKIVFEHYRQVTSCAVSFPDGELKTGIAVCSPDDECDQYTGRVVAIKRALGIPFDAQDYGSPKQVCSFKEGDIIESDVSGSVYRLVERLHEHKGVTSWKARAYADGELKVIFPNDSNYKWIGGYFAA